MSITWRKDGALVNTGIRDFGRRLVISLPAVSDSGYYECEASLRGGNVPSATAGAFLHVLGEPLLSSWCTTSNEKKICDVSIILLLSRRTSQVQQSKLA